MPPPRSKRPDTRVPYTTLFLSLRAANGLEVAAWSSTHLSLDAVHIAARSAHWPKPEFLSPCVCQHPDGYGHCRCVADRRVVGMGCLYVGFRSDPGDRKSVV